MKRALLPVLLLAAMVWALSAGAFAQTADQQSTSPPPSAQPTTQP